MKEIQLFNKILIINLIIKTILIIIIIKYKCYFLLFLPWSLVRQ